MSDFEYDQEGWGSDQGGDVPMDDRPQEEIEIENNFYEAEGVWKQDAERALIMFKRVVELEQSVSDKKFTFSSLTFIVLLTM